MFLRVLLTTLELILNFLLCSGCDRSFVSMLILLLSPSESHNVFTFYPYGRQTITLDDQQAVLDCLRGDFITQGPAVPAFEAALAAACHSPHAVAFNSATSALVCGLFGIGSGSW